MMDILGFIVRRKSHARLPSDRRIFWFGHGKYVGVRFRLRRSSRSKYKFKIKLYTFQIQ